jgi:2-dehydro-3-deoxyphosphogluconate aldolase/(4S)-4-hydroxy-2-oxoglutarate aldolase
MRTDAANEVIRRLGQEGICFGAGTVLTRRQAELALECGAGFIVSPGFSREVFECCAARGVLYVPGCATPTEIMSAAELGCEVIKLFPVSQLGGVGFVRAMSAVFPEMLFIPTGGVSDAEEYLALHGVLAVGRSIRRVIPGAP